MRLVILTVDLQEAKAAMYALKESDLMQSGFTHDKQYKACAVFMQKLEKEIARADRRTGLEQAARDGK